MTYFRGQFYQIISKWDDWDDGIKTKLWFCQISNMYVYVQCACVYVPAHAFVDVVELARVDVGTLFVKYHRWHPHAHPHIHTTMHTSL